MVFCFVLSPRTREWYDTVLLVESRVASTHGYVDTRLQTERQRGYKRGSVPSSYLVAPGFRAFLSLLFLFFSLSFSIICIPLLSYLLTLLYSYSFIFSSSCLSSLLHFLLLLFLFIFFHTFFLALLPFTFHSASPSLPTTSFSLLLASLFPSPNSSARHFLPTSSSLPFPVPSQPISLLTPSSQVLLFYSLFLLLHFSSSSSLFPSAPLSLPPVF